MDINSIIKNRRALPPRFFNGNEVSESMVLQILENATWAPNHKQTEPWRFLVYRGDARERMIREVKEKLLDLVNHDEAVNPGNIDKFTGNLLKANVVIVLVLEKDSAHRVPEWEEVAAMSCSVQNMWLTATALGLSAFWSTSSLAEKLTGYFGITENQRCLGFFLLGYSDVDYPSPGRTPAEQKTVWK